MIMPEEFIDKMMEKSKEYLSDIKDLCQNFAENVNEVAEKHGKDFPVVLKTAAKWINEAIRRCEEGEV